MADTARAAGAFGVDTMVGFAGSSIWQMVAMFPPVPAAMIDEGYADFARRWNPILEALGAYSHCRQLLAEELGLNALMVDEQPFGGGRLGALGYHVEDSTSPPRMTSDDLGAAGPSDLPETKGHTWKP